MVGYFCNSVHFYLMHLFKILFWEGIYRLTLFTTARSMAQMPVHFLVTTQDLSKYQHIQPERALSTMLGLWGYLATFLWGSFFSQETPLDKRHIKTKDTSGHFSEKTKVMVHGSIPQILPSLHVGHTGSSTLSKSLIIYKPPLAYMKMHCVDRYKTLFNGGQLLVSFSASYDKTSSNMEGRLRDIFVGLHTWLNRWI